MWGDCDNRRTVVTLGGPIRLRLKVRRCVHRACPRYHKPYRPESEGRWPLPRQEFGLDVIALVGALRYREHRGVPEITRRLTDRGVSICQRGVTNLLDRYDELPALSLTDDRRLRDLLKDQRRVILALDGLQPEAPESGARGALGAARLYQRRGAAGAEHAVGEAGRPGGADRAGA